MLRPVPSELIREGFRLPGALRDAHGVVVLQAGTTLTQELLTELEGEATLYAGLDWLENHNWESGDAMALMDELIAPGSFIEAEEEASSSADEGEALNVASLHPGMRLAQDLYDETDVLLLAAGMRVTPRFLDLLQQRSIRVVRLRATAAPDEADALQHAAAAPADSLHTRKLDEFIARECTSTIRLNPVRAWRRPRMPLDTLRAEAKRGLDQHTTTSTVVAESGEMLLHGGKVASTTLRASINSFLNMVTLDFDLLPLIVSMQRTQDEYLFDHCVNVALLSMSIAAQLGLGQDEIMKIGLGAMLHDIGMLRVPGSIRLAPRELTPGERLVVQRHPLHTLEMLDGVRGLPQLVRVIAFQVHERADGSGYPRGEVPPRLHPYAMIAGLADSYVAMTRPRPYRAAIMPYVAAKTLLVAGSDNKFDREIVRAFLDSICLFPIGSRVELSNGHLAVVIRANPDIHTKPVVEELDEQNRPTNTIVDLSQLDDLRVVRAHTLLSVSEEEMASP